MLWVTIVTAKAAEVTLPLQQNDNKLLLNADFNLASGNTRRDEVVMLIHGALAHKNMENISYLSELLRASGYNTLAINLSLGLSQRKGMYDCKLTHRHTNDDAVNEISAWVNWLTQQGAKHIYLLGHSRGGAQTALYANKYASSHAFKQIKAIALMAPATADNTNAITYQKRFKEPLDSAINKARIAMQQGRKHAVIKPVGLMTCSETSATAESFLSYYNNASQVDTPSLLSGMKIPVMVVVAGEDRVVVELDKKIRPLMKSDIRQLSIIDGAGHMFRDLNADEAVENITEYFHAMKNRKKN